MLLTSKKTPCRNDERSVRRRVQATTVLESIRKVFIKNILREHGLFVKSMRATYLSRAWYGLGIP